MRRTFWAMLAVSSLFFGIGAALADQAAPPAAPKAAPAAPASPPALDGNFWRQLTAEQKGLFLYGYAMGVDFLSKFASGPCDSCKADCLSGHPCLLVVQARGPQDPGRLRRGLEGRARGGEAGQLRRESPLASAEQIPPFRVQIPHRKSVPKPWAWTCPPSDGRFNKPTVALLSQEDIFSLRAPARSSRAATTRIGCLTLMIGTSSLWAGTAA